MITINKNPNNYEQSGQIRKNSSQDSNIAEVKQTKLMILNKSAVPGNDIAYIKTKRFVANFSIALLIKAHNVCNNKLRRMLIQCK